MAQFFLVLILLDPRSGDLHKFMMDRAKFTQSDCWNLAEYFKENPVRSFDNHGPWIVEAASCMRKYDD